MLLLTYLSYLTCFVPVVRCLLDFVFMTLEAGKRDTEAMKGSDLKSLLESENAAEGAA